MDNLEYFIPSIIESTGIVALSFALARVPLKWKTIFIVGIVLNFILFIIRSLPLTLGLHVPVGILLIYFFLIKKTYVSTSKSFLVVFISVFTLGLLEFFIHKVYFALFQLDIKEVININPLMIFLGLPQGIIMNLLAVVVTKFLKPVQGLWK